MYLEASTEVLAPIIFKCGTQCGTRALSRGSPNAKNTELPNYHGEPNDDVGRPIQHNRDANDVAKHAHGANDGYGDVVVDALRLQHSWPLRRSVKWRRW